MIYSGAGRCVSISVDVGVHWGLVLECTILFSDDLGLSEILTTETVDCNGTLGVAERWGVVIRAIVAPAFVIVGCGDLLGEDTTRDKKREYEQQIVTVNGMHR